MLANHTLAELRQKLSTKKPKEDMEGGDLDTFLDQTPQEDIVLEDDLSDTDDIDYEAYIR